ncbi:major facilitator superfamily domain-containing protein [Lipomyces starkeyi]
MYSSCVLFLSTFEFASSRKTVVAHADDALDVVGFSERVELTDEDSKRIVRKTDRVILTVLVWVYFLQILDKSVLGYDRHTSSRNEYSLIGSIAAIAQLAWQPFSSFLIVKVPHRILMPALLGLMAARFFLGLFEAGCLPLFSVITSQWYRRAEQPITATIIAAALSYGLAHIKSNVLKEWQIIFLFVGLVTIVSSPIVYWRLDNDIPSARFLTEEEKPQAAALEPKTYLWIGMAMLLNVGASVTNTFGPLILNGLGFDKYTTTLLNMPFGAIQIIVILLASYLAQKARIKGAILAAFILPVIAGLAVLYVLPRTHNVQGPLILGYYLLAFFFGGNPLIVTWTVGNTAGTTKKSVIMSVYNAASSAGNIVGPLLFNKKDAPAYHPGLRGCLGIFIALFCIVFIQWFNLIYLNRLQQRKRVRNGKKAKVVDHSMQSHYHAADEGNVEEQAQVRIGDNAFLDLTDLENDEFVYIY